MSYEAIRHGLELGLERCDWGPLRPTSSMSLFYKIMEYLPLRHLSYKGPDNTVFRWVTFFYESRVADVPRILLVDVLSSWHLQRPRLMKAGQLIHASVFEDKGYRPKALTHDRTAWDKDALKLLTDEDPYADAFYILHTLEKGGRLANQHINVINTLTTTGKLTLYCSHCSISKKCYSVQKSGLDLSLGTPTGLTSL